MHVTLLPALAKRLEIIVDDDGPGLTQDQRHQALARGVRLDEQSPGTGLGLAIVTDLASAYGGTLSLDRSPLGGCAPASICQAVPGASSSPVNPFRAKRIQLCWQECRMGPLVPAKMDQLRGLLASLPGDMAQRLCAMAGQADPALGRLLGSA